MTTRMPSMSTPIHTYTHTCVVLWCCFVFVNKNFRLFLSKNGKVMEKKNFNLTLMLLLHVLKIIVIIKVTTANDVLTKFGIYIKMIFASHVLFCFYFGILWYMLLWLRWCVILACAIIRDKELGFWWLKFFRAFLLRLVRW